MPYASEAQRRFFHTATAKKAGITPADVKHWDKASKGKDLPAHAALGGKMYRLDDKEKSVKEKVLQEIMDLMDAHEGAALGELKKPAAVSVEVSKLTPVEKVETEENGEEEDEDEDESEAAALQEGASVESEHTDNPRIQRKIASDHLAEDPKYYEKLEEMEKGIPSEDDKAKIAELYHRYCR